MHVEWCIRLDNSAIVSIFPIPQPYTTTSLLSPMVCMLTINHTDIYSQTYTNIHIHIFILIFILIFIRLTPYASRLYNAELQPVFRINRMDPVRFKEEAATLASQLPAEQVSYLCLYVSRSLCLQVSISLCL